jgi:hypothetical protein
MYLQQGDLKNEIVTDSISNFSLKGMISPSFQNQGTATVFIDGRIVKTGENYTINVPSIVLRNSIQIQFETDPSKTKILYLGYVKLIQ